MTLDFAGLVRSAWRLFRRDAELLLRIAGLFFFLPQYALVLLVPAIPVPDRGIDDRKLQAERWVDAVQTWMSSYGFGTAIGYLVVYFGMAVILALYLSGERPSLGEAMRSAVRLYPRFLLAMVVVSIPTGAGMYLLLLPGLYLMSRFLLAGPAVFAERPIGAVGAIARSWRVTSRAQFAVLGTVAFVYLAAMLLGQTFLLLGDAMTRSGAGNPVALAITGAGAASVAACSQIASAMIAITAYRRLAR